MDTICETKLHLLAELVLPSPRPLMAGHEDRPKWTTLDESVLWSRWHKVSLSVHTGGDPKMAKRLKSYSHPPMHLLAELVLGKSPGTHGVTRGLHLMEQSYLT